MNNLTKAEKKFLGKEVWVSHPPPAFDNCRHFDTAMCVDVFRYRNSEDHITMCIAFFIKGTGRSVTRSYNEDFVLLAKDMTEQQKEDRFSYPGPEGQWRHQGHQGQDTWPES